MDFTDSLGNIIKLPEGEKVEKRTSVYVAVFNPQHELLMYMPKDSSQWQLPGGGLEDGVNESPQGAAERECLEETGYQIKVNASEPLYTGTLNFFHSRKHRFYFSTHHIFDGRLVSDKPLSVSQEDKDGTVGWISLAALNANNTQITNIPIIDVLRRR